MKIKKIIAAGVAAAMATAALAITVSAGSDNVGTCPVTYVSNISYGMAMSTSGVSADPSKNTFSLSISSTFVYYNKDTKVTGSDKRHGSSTGNSCNTSCSAPLNCQMVSVASDHYFDINDDFGSFSSAASRSIT